MQVSLRVRFVTGIALGVGVFLGSFASSIAWSQGSGSSRATPSPPGAAPSAPPEEFHVKLWKYIIREQSPYPKWPSLPGKTGMLEAKSPHGPFARVFALKVDPQKPQDFPSGSVLVLENYAADRKTRTSIDIMYRSTGFDPKGGDWFWMKYLPTGRVATTPESEGGKPIVGRVKKCSDCHAKAQGADFVFSNDAPPPQTKDDAKVESDPANPLDKKEKP